MRNATENLRKMLVYGFEPVQQHIQITRNTARSPCSSWEMRRREIQGSVLGEVIGTASMSGGAEGWRFDGLAMVQDARQGTRIVACHCEEKMIQPCAVVYLGSSIEASTSTSTSLETKSQAQLPPQRRDEV